MVSNVCNVTSWVVNAVSRFAWKFEIKRTCVVLNLVRLWKLSCSAVAFCEEAYLHCVNIVLFNIAFMSHDNAYPVTASCSSLPVTPDVLALVIWCSEGNTSVVEFFNSVSWTGFIVCKWSNCEWEFVTVSCLIVVSALSKVCFSNSYICCNSVFRLVYCCFTFNCYNCIVLNVEVFRCIGVPSNICLNACTVAVVSVYCAWQCRNYALLCSECQCVKGCDVFYSYNSLRTECLTFNCTLNLECAVISIEWWVNFIPCNLYISWEAVFYVCNNILRKNRSLVKLCCYVYRFVRFNNYFNFAVSNCNSNRFWFECVALILTLCF